MAVSHPEERKIRITVNLPKDSLRLFTIAAWRRLLLLYRQRKGIQVTPIYLI